MQYGEWRLSREPTPCHTINGTQVGKFQSNVLRDFVPSWQTLLGRVSRDGVWCGKKVEKRGGKVNDRPGNSSQTGERIRKEDGKRDPGEKEDDRNGMKKPPPA